MRFDCEHVRYYTSTAAALCMTAAKGLVTYSTGHDSDYRYLLAILTNAESGLIDSVHPGFAQFPSVFKVSSKRDPDLPTYHEAMVGPDRELYEDAMVVEVKVGESWYVDGHPTIFGTNRSKSLAINLGITC
jgi:hypothetical protein